MAKRMGSIRNLTEGTLGFVYTDGRRLTVVTTELAPVGGSFLGELYLQEHDGHWTVGFAVGRYADSLAHRHSRQLWDLLCDQRDRLRG